MAQPLADPGAGPSGNRRSDAELLALYRRIARLEDEIAVANRAVNELLVRTTTLDRLARESARALEAERTRFCEYLDRDIRRLTTTNDELHERITDIANSRGWRLACFVRTVRGRFR